MAAGAVLHPDTGKSSQHRLPLGVAAVPIDPPASPNNRVRLAVRVRPFLDLELKGAEERNRNVDVSELPHGSPGPRPHVADFALPAVFCDSGEGLVEAHDHTVPFSKRLTFRFDATFDERATDQELHAALTQEVVSKVLGVPTSAQTPSAGGQHATVLVHGPSRSGKTTTLNCLIKASVLQLLRLIGQQSQLSYTLSVAFIGT